MPKDPEAGPSLGGSAPAWSQTGDPAGERPNPAPRVDSARWSDGGLLGQGGMGRVMAVHDHALQRVLARKETAPGSPIEYGARLLREAEVIARLDHPGILPVYDVGRHEDGRPWYTMPVLRGRTLEQAMEGRGAAERLALVRPFQAAVEAVAYAHAQGVIHRDLKPANVLLGDLGEVRVIDWGLARDLAKHEQIEGETGGAGASLTRMGAVVGTPSWIAPEAARGGQADRRTDVFGLGAILHHLLVGSPPWPGSEAKSVLAAAREGHIPATTPTGGSVPPELLAIMLRALAGDPADRYPDARALAEDLGHWLDGRRVTAHRYSPRELLLRTLAAWKGPLLVALVALVALLGVGAEGARRVILQRNRAVAAESNTRIALTQADESLARTLAVQALEFAQGGARHEAERLATRSLSLREDPAMRGVLALFGATPLPVRTTLAVDPACRSAVVNAPGTRWLCLTEEAISLRAVGEQEPVWRRVGRFSAAAFSPNGEWVHALEGQAGMPVSRLLDLSVTTGEPSGALGPVLSPGAVLDVQRSRVLLSAQVEGVAERAIWSVETGRHRPLGRCGPGRADPALREVPYLLRCFDGRLLTPWSATTSDRAPAELAEVTAWASLDSGHLLVGTQDGRLRHLGGPKGLISAPLPARVGSVRRVRTGVRGALVAVEGAEGIALMDPDSLDWSDALPREERVVAGVLDDGSLATWGDGRLSRWAWAEPPRPSVHQFPRGLSSVRPSPSGRELLVTGAGNLAVAWSLDDWNERARFDSGVDEDCVVKAGAWSADGSRVAAVYAGAAGTVLYASSTGRILARHSARAPRVAFLRGRLYAPSFGPLLVVETRREELTVQDLPFTATDLDDDEGQAAILDLDGGIWVTDGSAAPRLVGTQPGASSLALSQGRVLVALAGRLEWVDAIGGASLPPLVIAAGAVVDLDVSADGSLLALGMDDGELRILASDGTLLALGRGHAQRIASVAFAPASRGPPTRLYTGGWDGALRVWDLARLRAPVSVGAELSRTGP